MSRPSRKEPTERERSMAADYRAGKTLKEIGDAHGVTRERIRQILERRFGMNAMHGGQHTKAVQKRIKRDAARDALYLRTKGCSFAQYCELRSMLKPTRAFSQQRKNAHTRGISWELSLWQWWTIWKESGLWEQRGRGQGYVMCRRGDEGPYSTDNVFIERAPINCSERKAKKSGLPIGVRRQNKSGNRFLAVRNINGKRLRLGIFTTPEAAHAAYIAANPIQVAA